MIRHSNPVRRTGILALFTLLVLLMAGSLLSGQAQPAPRGSDGAKPEDGVYRVYYDTRERLADLAVHFDIWEVHAEGYAWMALSGADAARLLAQGYSLELDVAQTIRQVLGPPGYPCYRDVDALYAALQQFNTEHPDLTELIDYGDSWHKITPGDEPGDDLLALKISNEQIELSKPRFFLMANIHARELTTPETALYFVTHLLENYGQDADVTWIVDYTEIYVVATANPDGRRIVEGGCYQRKNGNDDQGSCYVCDPFGFDHYGVDLNRNNPYGWGGAGTDPCGQTYQGQSAASEPETYALNALVRTLFPDQRAEGDDAPAPSDATGLLISLHSYSNLVLWPWGWTYSSAPNQTALQTLGRKFAYFNGYQPQQSSDLYPATGDTTDWAYGELGVPAYTFELGETFFQSCADLEQIREENLGALLYGAKVARTPYRTPSGPDVLDLTVPAQPVPRGEMASLSVTLDDTRYNHANGAEPSQNIAAAEFYVDVPPWITATTPVAAPLAATDGAFDAPVEPAEATLDTLGLSEGRHILFVRGQDAAGNWGAFSAAFLDVISPTAAAALRPLGGSQVAGPGGQAVYTATVTNLTEGDESFDLGVGGNAWTTTLSITATQPLPYLGAASVRATVAVPIGAGVGQADTFTLTATLEGEDSPAASSRFTTAVVRGLFLPLLRKGP